MNTEIFSPVTLPSSGRTVTNRLVKVALYEHLAKMYGGPPNKYHMGLYAEWAKHDWGMIITGNVQVSRDHLTLCRDTVVPEVLDEEALASFRKLSRTIHAKDSRALSMGPLAIMQLSHVGRQSPNFIGGRKLGIPPIAPSPVRLGSNKCARLRVGTTHPAAQGTPHPYMRIMFQQPREMTLDDIKQVQQAFIKGALTALNAGFDGVQLHCAHGYLLAQFLNPKSNVRRDAYSVESQNALRMMHEIVKGIRAVVPKEFIVGVKINSADYVEASEQPSDERILEETQRVLGHVRTIALWRIIDFIEISGGDYESPDFMSSKAASPRQAFFAQFSKKARDCLKTSIPADSGAPLVLLTGGLRSPAHLQTALEAGHADLLGIGRGSIVRPDIPTILQERIRAVSSGTQIASEDEPFAREPDIRLPSWVPQIPLIGAGVNLAWYQVHLRRIALSRLEKGLDSQPSAPSPTFGMTGIEAMLRMWFWLEWHELVVGALVVVSLCHMGIAVLGR